MGLTLKLYYFSRPATVPRGLYGGWQAHRNKSPGWGLIGKSKAAPAQCSWYVFILGGVAIHLSVCMAAYVCVCVCEGPEANSTRLCIHYLPWCRHYRVIAHGDRVNVYHRKRFSWSKITAETERVVPVSAGADKLSPGDTDAIVLCDVNPRGANCLDVTGAAVCDRGGLPLLSCSKLRLSHLIFSLNM